MDYTQPEQVVTTLSAQGYGGVAPRELAGTLTLNGALPSTPEAFAVLTEAWQMRSEDGDG